MDKELSYTPNLSIITEASLKSGSVLKYYQLNTIY